MNASAFQAGIHAVVGFGGLASVHAVSEAVPALTVPQGIWLFLASFGRELLNYLDRHPVLNEIEPPPTSPAK